MKKRKKEEKRQNYLKQIYFNPSHPAAFSGIDKISKFLSERGKYHFTREEIKKWLQSQEVHSTNLLPKYFTKRRKVIVPYIDYMWDVDTASLQDYAKENEGFGYFMLAIDIFSRFVWCVAIKTPSGNQVKKAFTSIFHSKRLPERVRTDKGSEYTNREVEKYFKENDIIHFVTQNEVKANFAERAIQSIKGKIMRYMRAKQTRVWFNQLENIVKSYNKTYHRSIKQSPISVTKEDENKIWNILYPMSKVSLPKVLHYRFNVGDIVRISKLRVPFQRYYNEHWTNELFIIKERDFQQYIPVYHLTDYAKENIEGIFYENELQKVIVDENTKYNIEKVIKERMNNGRKEVLVRWVGWPKKFDSWIPSKDIKSFSH
jgi:hypothetical protein